MRISLWLIPAGVAIAAAGCWLATRDAGAPQGAVRAPPATIAAPAVAGRVAPSVPARPQGLAPPRVLPADSAALVDQWIGRWEGVEGRFMIIARDPVAGAGYYRVTMRYGAAPAAESFPATAAGASIIVERANQSVMFNRTDGKAAGDQRLFDRRDCLADEAGEAYCRG